MTRILVVEDEEHLAEGLRFNLEAEGYEVAIAPDGSRAVEMLAARERGVDLVILDLMLPGLSGFEVLRRARAAGDFVPVLILTAKDAIEDRVRGLEEGADDYLVKPFRLDELLARTRGLLRRRRWDGVADGAPPEPVAIGAATLHFDRFELETPAGVVNLTTREMGLLRALVDRGGRGGHARRAARDGLGAAPRHAHARRRQLRRAAAPLSRARPGAPAPPALGARARLSVGALNASGRRPRAASRRRAKMGQVDRSSWIVRSIVPPSPSVRNALTFFVDPVLENATLVAAFEGWNDAGEAATGAARYVEAAIRAVPLAEIDGEEFLDFTVCRPWVRAAAAQVSRSERKFRAASRRRAKTMSGRAKTADGARTIEWPVTRVSYGATAGSRELVVAIGAEPHLRWRAYCDLFASLVRRLRVKRVVLLGAYVADVVYSRPVDVTGFASDADRLAAIGVAPSRYEGPTGIVGVLGELLRADGVPVLSLWAGLPHYISASPNPRGALALVQKLASDLPLAIDEAPLRADAAAFEDKISALVSGDPELSEYVRLLKKREFAQ